MNPQVKQNSNISNNLSSCKIATQKPHNTHKKFTSCDIVSTSQNSIDETISLYNMPQKSLYSYSNNQPTFCGNFFSKFIPYFPKKNMANAYNNLIKNTQELSIESLLKVYKSIVQDMSVEDFEKLRKHIDYISSSKNLDLFNIYIGNSPFDYKFIIDFASKLNKNLSAKGIKIINNVQYEKMASKSKDVTKMTDAEIIQYYKDIVPFINKTELDCLLSQIHRIQKGEPRYLNTPQEQEILRTLKAKQQCGLLLKGINTHFGFIDTSVHPKGNIPFVKKELTDYQYSQLRGWTWSGAHPIRVEELFDDLAITISEDMYLYRGIKIDPRYQSVVDYFNSIKIGSIIDNSKRYISTAQDIKTALSYFSSHAYGFNQSYILKIKVPKGTKAIDNRIYEGLSFDEFILPPNKLKVTNIDYNTGVVECEYIGV